MAAPPKKSMGRNPSLSALTMGKAIEPVDKIRFHHVQFFVDRLETLAYYKTIEDTMNAFSPKLAETTDEKELQAAFAAAGGKLVLPEDFAVPGQDLVDQMIHGLGWRIVGHHESATTRSLLLSSKDPKGVKFVISAATGARGEAINRQRREAEAAAEGGDGDGEITQAAKRKRSASIHEPAITESDESFQHFDLNHLNQFFAAHNGRQGVGVLSFEVEHGGVDKICASYSTRHPELLCSNGVIDYQNGKVIEVYAYYLPDANQKNTNKPDRGTILRFSEEHGGDKLLPGLLHVDHKFADTVAVPAYFDHWVSNVVDRTGFLDTLHETLGFTPKVDFNAGVVAAGEAQIESTVTGNHSDFATQSLKDGLKNQSQVYLPINNALSEVGHVHFFLKEIGQGIQHLASRVNDLPKFVAGVNAMRRYSGHGFTFLNIPRSYYGRLVVEDMTVAGRDAGLADPISANLGKALMKALQDSKQNLMNAFGVVKMRITHDDVKNMQPSIPPTLQVEFLARVDDISKIVMRSQYVNLYKLLRDHVNVATYLMIVENKVLVDIQNDDVLFQIFTCTVTQREAGQEAPFLEFIQRVCSQKSGADGKPKKIVAGCGGFGIRNFLTLFLSIELGKASNDLDDALANNDAAKIDNCEKRIKLFTSQLEESNPVLTEISDAMTAEGVARDDFGEAASDEAKARCRAEYEKYQKLKEAGNAKLQEISCRYKLAARKLRGDA